jgi:hypothetical protein
MSAPGHGRLSRRSIGVAAVPRIADDFVRLRKSAEVGQQRRRQSPPRTAHVRLNEAREEFSGRTVGASLGCKQDAIQAIISSSRGPRCCDARRSVSVGCARVLWVAQRGRHRDRARRYGPYFHGYPPGPGLDIPSHRQHSVRRPGEASLVVGRQGRHGRAGEVASCGQPARGGHRRYQGATRELSPP